MTSVTNQKNGSESAYGTSVSTPGDQQDKAVKEQAQKALNPGAVTLAATESEPLPSKANAAVASAKSLKDANVYTLENYEVRWNGKKYLLSIDFPCRDWKKLSPTQLEGEARRFADLFVADLLSNLNKETDHAIKPGDDFEILFDEHGNGYTAVVPAPGFNVLTQPLDKIKEQSGRWVAANQASSKALSKYVQIDSSKFREFGENLTRDPDLKSLHATVSNEAGKTAFNADPVNLKHHNSNCFINSAFAQLVNEPNEEIRNALRDPQNYVDGENNRLLKAIREYDARQASGRGGKCDIQSLGWEDQLDLDAVVDAAGRFIEFFKEEIDESLKKFLEIPDKQTITESLSLQQAAQNSTLNDAQLPDVLNVYTPRVTNPEEFSALFSDDELLKIHADLKKELDAPLDLKALDTFFNPFKFKEESSELDKGIYLEMRAQTDPSYLKLHPEKQQILDNLAMSHQDLQRELHKYYYQQLLDVDAFGSSDEEIKESKLRQTKTILNDEKLYQGALYFLSETLRNHIAEVRQKNFKVTAVNTPIAIDENGKVTITKNQKSSTYELTSFLAYAWGNANSGHYVTYLRKGDRCWILDDLKPEPQSINIDAFVKAASTKGCYYRLHKVGSLPNSAQVAQASQEESAISKLPETEIDQTGVTYSEDEGSMRSAHKQGFTLINPTDSTLKAMHPQLQEVRSAALTQEAYDSALKTDASWYQYLSKPTFNWGRMPKPLLVSNVLFTPTDSVGSEKQVKEATKKALESATKLKKSNLAFPVFKCGTESEDTIVGWMKSAIEEFIKENSHKWLNGGQIKIIRPKKPDGPGKTSSSPEPLPTPPLLPANPSPPAEDPEHNAGHHSAEEYSELQDD